MKFLPYPYILYFLLIACPAALIFPLAWLYSLALTRGIASARDEQHRMTPLSPWSYFWMKSKRLLILTACLAPPWLLLAIDIPFPTVAWEINNWRLAMFVFWMEIEQSGAVPSSLLLLFNLSFFGLASLIFATITGFAPRNSRPIRLTTFGLSVGLLCWGIFIAALDRATSEYQFYAFLTLFALFGFLSFILGWLHVRFRLNRAWFRIEIS